ncbi:MAG: hypothetical protein HQK96_09485 [Nitrospirae bacterium]|nr:hypothetical protein [Nitrospirota bacterium]
MNAPEPDLSGLLSMWKVKSSTTDAPPFQESPTQTSETFRFPSPSTNDILSNPDEVIKRTAEALTPKEQIFAGHRSTDDISNSNKPSNKEDS